MPFRNPLYKPCDQVMKSGRDVVFALGEPVGVEVGDCLFDSVEGQSDGCVDVGAVAAVVVEV